MLRELSRSGPGRAGLILGAVLLALAGWVLLTFPLDFGPRLWSDPSVLAATIPGGAHPAWTALFAGPSAAQHRILAATAPASERTAGAAILRTYALPFDYQQDAPPTFLSFNLGSVSYGSRPPSLSVVLVRPDGQELPLLRTTVSGPRPGESPPYRRNVEGPDRVLLSGEDLPVQSAVKMLAQRYGLTVDPAALQGRPEPALFGVPDGAGGYTPLHGSYRIEVRAALAEATEASPLWVPWWAAPRSGWRAPTRRHAERPALAFGLPIALLIGISAAVVSTAIGTGLGLLSGYAGGRIDLVIQRSADIVNNVPLLPLLIFMVFVLGSQLWLVLLGAGGVELAGLTILIRSMVLGIRDGNELEAARALGASHRHIIWRHVFPHTAPYVLTQLMFFVPAAILAEAGLSLGLGDPSLPTWRQFLEDGFNTGAVFLGYWWWVVTPGLMIVVTAVTFMLIAVAMEPIVDPRLRSE